MEPRTLEELYRRYAGELYLYAYSLCQNEAQAQDLTAEAFCRALLALDGADAGWRLSFPIRRYLPLRNWFSA